MLNWSSFDRHHNRRHSEYSPCSSFPSLVFFPSVWKFRLQRHLFLPSSGLTSSFHPIPIQSSNDTCHPKYSFSFHLRKISAVSVVGISDGIRSDMIKLQVGLPRARAEIPCTIQVTDHRKEESLLTTCKHECDGGRLGITEGVFSFVG